MDWIRLQNHIKEEHPFLARTGFGLEETEHFSLPPLLTIGSLAAIKAINDRNVPARLAMIFPHSDSVACFMAAAASLAAIRKQVEKGLPTLPELKSGEKVLLDGVDYIYQGEEMIGGEPFMVFSYQGGIQKVPARERLRVQHSVSNRKLTKRDKKPIESVVDPILETKLRGNTSLFQTSVILLSRVYSVREQVSDLNVAADKNVCSKLANIFGWGSLSEEGEVRIWGSAGRKEEPLVLVSSNFSDACEYLEYNSHKTELIIVDGASYLKDLSSFETLLGKSIPVVFILSGKDQEGVRYLKKKDFDFWAWNSEDINKLNENDSKSEKSPFYQFSKKIASFASFKVNVTECSNDSFSLAFDLMNRLRREMTEEDYHASQILDRMFAFFLRVTRLVSFSDSSADKSARELASIEADLSTFRYYFKPEFFEVFSETLESLKQGNMSLKDENSKPARLRSEIGKRLSSGDQKICVVLSKNDYQAEKEYLKKIFPKNRVVFERNASFKMRDDYDCVILCGYLKRNHLLRIFDEALSAKLVVFNYPHEKEWTSSVKKQFFGAFDSIAFRNGRVFGRTFAAESVQPVVDHPPKTPAMEEFEIKLNEFRKQRILLSINEDSSGYKVSARCVTLNQGSFAFLTESYSVPVINELLGGKTKFERLPQKKVKDIHPGDFLLFRERGGRNLIREMADFGLNKSGKSDLRATASRWREALMKIYENNDRSLSKVKAELKKYGCERNEMTIKNWLFDEIQIAPGEDDDIAAIAEAAGDATLKGDLKKVTDAISQVRSAHLQAAKQVARLLEKRVKGDLGELSESDTEIKVPGLGKVFVVCVESIDSATTEIPGHKANRLLKEKERENGSNDSATTIV